MESPNQIKAKEIAHEYFRKGQLGLVPCDTENAGYECAIKAMQWKDEQILLDDDDKLATEVKVDGVTIKPPQGYLIGKVTYVMDSLIVEFKKH